MGAGRAKEGDGPESESAQPSPGIGQARAWAGPRTGRHIAGVPAWAAGRLSSTGQARSRSPGAPQRKGVKRGRGAREGNGVAEDARRAPRAGLAVWPKVRTALRTTDQLDGLVLGGQAGSGAAGHGRRRRPPGTSGPGSPGASPLSPGVPGNRSACRRGRRRSDDSGPALQSRLRRGPARERGGG